jgi:hypothetical protein
MSRRKGEVTGHMNEREFPHLVELKLPPGGFRSQNLEFDAFHREYGIPIRRGRGRHEVEQFHVRFCFPDAPTADAFRERFGGTRLTSSPFQARASLRPESSVSARHSPTVVDGKIMTRAGLAAVAK